MSALVDCFICHQTGYYTWRIILGHILDLHQLADKNECRVCNSCIHILKLLYNSEKAAEQKKAPVQVPLYYEQAPQKKSLQSGQRSVLIMFRFILVTLCLPWMCIHIIPPLSWTCTWISPLNWANPSIKALKATANWILVRWNRRSIFYAFWKIINISFRPQKIIERQI